MSKLTLTGEMEVALDCEKRALDDAQRHRVAFEAMVFKHAGVEKGDRVRYTIARADRTRGAIERKVLGLVEGAEIAGDAEPRIVVRRLRKDGEPLHIRDTVEAFEPAPPEDDVAEDAEDDGGEDGALVETEADE